VQFKKDDRSKENMVKREGVDSSNYMREERFSYPERTSKPFINNDICCSEFIIEWHKKNRRLARWMIHPEEYASIALQAAEGESNHLSL
jgi:hypothetical protein